MGLIDTTGCTETSSPPRCGDVALARDLRSLPVVRVGLGDVFGVSCLPTRECDSGQVTSDEITTALVERLVGSQFPQWATLPLSPAPESGVDNRTFRLGDEFVIRLPSAERYAHQVEKEQRWLPMLAPKLPLPIPEPVGLGQPEFGYPWRWSIYRWLSGESARSSSIADLNAFAAELGKFLTALHQIDPAGAPPATDRNWFRARAQDRDEQTRTALEALRDVVDVDAALDVWDAARRAPELETPTWIHGDVAATNLLVTDGRLSAVIDFGCSGIGDPAFDLEIAWDLLSDRSRAIFQQHVGLDDAAWCRGRGWKLWATARALVEGLGTDAEWVDWARRVVGELIIDHQRART